MLKLLAYLFEFRLIVASGLMLVWGVMVAIKHTASTRLWFRLMPLVFAIVMLGSTIYHPISITSPMTGVVAHPGDSIPVTVELHPAFLSALFPSVGLDLPACWTCNTAPTGVKTHGVLAGSPYRFVIELPKTVPDGILVTSATAAMDTGRHPAMRSAFIELVVKPEIGVEKNKSFQ